MEVNFFTCLDIQIVLLIVPDGTRRALVFNINDLLYLVGFRIVSHILYLTVPISEVMSQGQIIDLTLVGNVGGSALTGVTISLNLKREKIILMFLNHEGHRIMKKLQFIFMDFVEVVREFHNQLRLVDKIGKNDLKFISRQCAANKRKGLNHSQKTIRMNNLYAVTILEHFKY
ncbi:hypothetical protein KUTeg_000703 [Tegillarca granosa]|uniref:Uncharacterized protein n=1 Tax=Tegillarca granosa TaxID=220873 RepID=A0ABQ9FZD0_TEGGR|nr:hypothetical protein KUTeg_000703 [Tegillarca granosa]